MTTASKLVCEITESGLTSISCALPDPRWIDTIGGLGAGLGTLVAAIAAVFGVYEAFKQRNRADKIERKNLLKSTGEHAMDSLESFAELQGKERYEEAQEVLRTMFDFSKLLSDGDAVEKRYSDSLISLISTLVELSLHQRRGEGGTSLDATIYNNLDHARNRSLVRSAALQSRSALNVILNVSSKTQREVSVGLFEKRAESLVTIVNKEIDISKK